MALHHVGRRVLSIVTSGALLMGWAGAVCAQPAGQTKPAPIASSFDELKSRIRAGGTIFVTDSAGREAKGELGQLSDTSLELLVNGQTQTFSNSNVRLVSRRQRDSLWNGFLIGAAAGIAPAVYWLIADPNECGGSICMSDLVSGMIPAAAIGLSVDAAIRRKVVVYSGPSSSSTTRTGLTIAPMAGPRKGVELVVSF